MFVQTGRRADRERRPTRQVQTTRRTGRGGKLQNGTYHEKQKYLHDMHSILRIGETCALRSRRHTRSPVPSSRATIRERLMKIAARVIEHVARIRIQLRTRFARRAHCVAP